MNYFIHANGHKYALRPLKKTHCHQVPISYAHMSQITDNPGPSLYKSFKTSLIHHFPQIKYHRPWIRINNLRVPWLTAGCFRADIFEAVTIEEIF